MVVSLSKELFDQLQPGDLLQFQAYPLAGRWVVFRRRKEHDPAFPNSFWFVWVNGERFKSGRDEGWDTSRGFFNFFIRDGVKHEG